MNVVGIDAHKKTHTLVVVDPVGRRIAQLTVPATTAGHARACEWIGQFGQVLVAVEDCRHLTRRFEVDLLMAGHAVVRVHTRLMAGARRSARERGKSDPIDAEAVARVALREPDLPKACLDGAVRDVKLIVDHRRRLVRYRTASANKLRWFLHEIDPELPVPSRGLRRLCVFDALETALRGRPGVVVEIALDLIAECRRLTEQVNAMEHRLRRLVQQLAPHLLAIPGCGVLGAAAILGRDRRCSPVQVQGRLCALQRHGTDSGVVLEQGPRPAQPGRQSHHQQCPPHDRGHPDAWRRRRRCLLRQTARCRQDGQGGPPPSQTPYLGPRLSSASGR